MRGWFPRILSGSFLSENLKYKCYIKRVASVYSDINSNSNSNSNSNTNTNTNANTNNNTINNYNNTNDSISLVKNK